MKGDYPLALAHAALRVRDELRGRVGPDLRGLAQRLPLAHPLRSELVRVVGMVEDAAVMLSAGLKGHRAQPERLSKEIIVA